ncbi:MAG: HlyD family type I secretion periplasmic adaptor subunit [Endozoicomonas sp.]
MLEGLRELRELWKSSRDYHDRQPVIERNNQELEFLPAAVEILETPASPLGRTTGILITVLFSLAVLWAWVGHIDIESVAEGKVIPRGQVKAVQPLEIGKIEEILVTEGEHVVTGQALVKLDPTETETDAKRARLEWQDAKVNAFRLKLLLEHMNDNASNNLDLAYYLKKAEPELLQNISGRKLLLQQSLLNRDLESYHASQAMQTSRIEEQQASISATRRDITRLETIKPLHDEQEKSHAELLAQGSASRLEWLSAREKQVETSQSLMIQRSRLAEAEARLQSLRKEGIAQNQKLRSDKLQELLEYRKKEGMASLDMTTLNERVRNRYLRAPVDGTVHQMQVHTVGGVVQPAEPLMVIVPDDVPLEIEAFLLNKDVGFVNPGQHAEIKVESFPYTRYGLIDGEVRHVSRDSIEQEGKGRVYPMRVTLKETRIQVKDRWESLQPGMSVTVEVKTGKRRLLEFFLAPFMRYQDESMKER